MENTIREEAEKVAKEAKFLRSTLFDSPGWQDLGVKDGVHGYKKKEGSTVYIKGITTVPHPPKKVADFIWDPANSNKFETNVGFFKILHNFGMIRIEHKMKNLPWPVANRDMVTSASRENIGKDIHIVTKSIEIGVPQEKRIVRATNFITSYYMKDIEDKSTEISYMTGVNPNGSIPGFIISQLSERQAFHLSKIRDNLV